MKFIHLLILCMLYVFSLYAQESSRNSLDKQLEKFKNENNLSDWIYTRIAYNAEKPENRLAFLMASETEVWRKPKTPEEFEAWLNLLVNQGYYQLYSGDVLRSIEQYEKAYSVYQLHPIKNFDLIEYIFKPLGNNYTRLGDYSNALFIQQKSLKLAISRKDSLAAASLYSNLSISYKSMGDLTQAEAMCLNGFRYLNSKNELYGLLRSTLADIQYESGRLNDAEKNIATAIVSLASNKKNPNTSYWLLSAYTVAGNIAFRKKDLDRASKFYTTGMQIIDNKFNGSRRREKANLLIQTGNICIDQKKPKNALKYYNRALQLLIPDFIPKNNTSLPSITSLYGENRIYEALEGRAFALSLSEQKEESLKNYLFALTTGDKFRNEFGDDKDRLYYQKQSKKLAELAIDLAYSLWIKTKNPKYPLTILALAEQTKARTLSDQLQRNRQCLTTQNEPLFKQELALKRAIVYYEKESLFSKDKPSLLVNKQEAQYKLAILHKEIRNKYPSWDRNLTEETSIQKALALVPGNVTFINFFWGENTAYAIVAKTGSIENVVKLDSAKSCREDIQDYIMRYFKNGPSSMINHPDVYFTTSNSIYKQLLGKTLAYSGQNKLIIIPDDILGYLPFESLITSEKYTPSIAKWPFLIKDTEISYAYSMYSWLKQKQIKPVKIFNGFFIKQTSGEPIAIPAVAIEEKLLKEKVKGSYFTDTDASIKNFKNALVSSEILHISTHSYLFGDTKEPALQLSDGKYFLFELGALHTSPSLIVLGACRTADGKIASGEGVLSLSRGFTAAGSTGVIAGLWNINDKSSSQLISSFYEKLHKGEDAATALHQSKISWLTKSHSNQALLLPYYWGSLIYIGSPQIISIEKPISYNLLYIVIVTAFILTVLAILFIKGRKKS